MFLGGGVGGEEGAQEFVRAESGDYAVKLTPTKNVPKDWLGDLNGKKVLGLASGGGQQMPVFIALGAECTVLDYSGKQLEAERIVAEREGYRINIIRADMSNPLPFDPVSSAAGSHSVAARDHFEIESLLDVLSQP